MALPPLIRPHVNVQPTLDTAIWFLQLRWVAVLGQLLTMAVVAWGLQITLPTIELLSLIGVTATTNGFYWFWLNHLHRTGVDRTDRLPSEQVVPALMLTDILVLTGMLYLTAGIANPFALFYFVNVAVAGAIITPVWAWAVWVTTVAGVTLLLIRSNPLDPLTSVSLQAGADANSSIWTIPKFGFLVSFAACSGVIVYFITILTGELRQREHAMQEAEDARVRNRQLEGLATLAAGAAHELASPMTTIAVIAKELSRTLEGSGAPDSTKQDVLLIRSELDQCRQILDRMTTATGEAAGEKLRSIELQEFLDETLLGIRSAERVEISISERASFEPDNADQAVAVTNLLPVQAAAQAIRNLIQNALDASSDQQVVRVEAESSASGWRISVIDQGHGMPPEVLARVCEPFFTTKEPGRGMGLGLHLSQNVIRRLDGELDFESRVGEGTKVVVSLPVTRT